MIKKILLIFFIILFLIVSVFYIRLRNDVDKIFWDSVGWASIAGTCQAEADYFNGDIKKEHYENLAKENLTNKGLLGESNTACWKAFSHAYNLRLEKFEIKSEKSIDEKNTIQEYKNGI